MYASRMIVNKGEENIRRLFLMHAIDILRCTVINLFFIFVVILKTVTKKIRFQ